jgi:glutathione S-transferase
LFGETPKEMAIIEMWQRRIELHLLFPIAHVFRNSHPGMKEMEVPQVQAWAEANKPRVMEFLDILDRELQHRPFVAGNSYSIADITGLVSIDFLKPAKLTVPDALSHVKRWHADVSARPSAKA